MTGPSFLEGFSIKRKSAHTSEPTKIKCQGRLKTDQLKGPALQQSGIQSRFCNRPRRNLPENGVMSSEDYSEFADVVAGAVSGAGLRRQARRLTEARIQHMVMPW